MLLFVLFDFDVWSTLMYYVIGDIYARLQLIFYLYPALIIHLNILFLNVLTLLALKRSLDNLFRYFMAVFDV